MVRLRFLGYLFLTSLICVLLGSAPIRAEQKGYPKYSTKVRLVVASEDTSLKAEATSYLSRELRSLGDVIIVDKDAEWELKVVALKLLYENGKGYDGYVISMVVLKAFREDVMNLMLKMFSIEDNAKKNIIGLTSGLSKWKANWVVIEPPNNLRRGCEGLVAIFDSQHLEEDRKSWQSTIDEMKKKSNQE